jgi:cyclophilin family peptidyl-prolyl cis-trans isomerase
LLTYFRDHLPMFTLRYLLRGLGKQRTNSTPVRKSNTVRRIIPRLEILEDRVTPASFLADGVVIGNVFVDGGNHGVAGVEVDLTGTTTSGRTVSTSTTTDANGGYLFSQMLPGTYSLTRVVPKGFVDGGKTGIFDFAVAPGQVSNHFDLTVQGVQGSAITLGYFLATPVNPRFTTPPAGNGNSVTVFSLDSATPLTSQSLATGQTKFLDLSANFFDPDTTNGTVVTFNTSQGAINVKLFDKDAPQTVTNFLNYLEAGDYNNDVFHRMSNLSQTNVKNPPTLPYQILQGGGFTVSTNTNGSLSFSTVQAFQSIVNEFSAAHQNLIGTISMARQSAPNSATSQFFFNLTDNTQALNGSNGGGFAVFGQVVGASDVSTLQSFTTTYNSIDGTNANAAFTTLPVKNYPPSGTPTPVFPDKATTANLALTNSITVTQPPTGHLTYAIIGNSNPNVVTATLGSNTSTSTFSANQLQLKAGSVAGTSVITVQITDNRGESVTKQFTVTT